MSPYLSPSFPLRRPPFPNIAREFCSSYENKMGVDSTAAGQNAQWRLFGPGRTILRNGKRESSEWEGGVRMEDDPSPAELWVSSKEGRLLCAHSRTRGTTVFRCESSFRSLTESPPLIQVRRRRYPEKKELERTKKKGGGRIIPGDWRGGNLSRNNELCAIDFPLRVFGGKSSRRLFAFISLCHREERRRDILMNSGGNSDEEFSKWE